MFIFFTFICPCITNIIPNYNQQDATFLDLFIYFYRRSTLSGGSSAHHQEHITVHTDQFWFQLMHHNFTLLTKSLYITIMHGQQHIKICTAKQAKDIHRYKTTKIKLYRINAAVWFNKTCRLKQPTPKYSNIKVNGNNVKAERTRVLHKPTNRTVLIRDDVEPVV